jgi:methionyl aminopeptidase
VGDADPAARRLVRVGRECLERAVQACVPGGRLSDVARAVESHASANGYDVVREYTGHGIGRRLHEDPRVPNAVDDDLLAEDLLLEPGLCIAIEPMLVEGRADVRTLADGWTVVTRDGTRAAHWEDVVAVTVAGPVVLTRAA